MMIFSSIFLIFILIITAKLLINVENLEKNQISHKIIYKIKIGIYVLGCIKIFGISLTETGIHCLGFSFKYPKISINKIKKSHLKTIFSFNYLKNLKIKFQKIQIQIGIGFENIMLTVFSVFAISTFFSILLAQNIKNINPKRTYYNVSPIYNKNAFNFKISLNLSINIFNLIKTIKIPKKQKESFKMKQVTLKI